MIFNIEVVSELFIVIAVLVALVNIITEVIKNTFELKDARVINITVLVISEILTAVSFLTYFQLCRYSITWYVAVAFLVVGIMVAYAAMFGYDKLLSYFKDIKNEN